MLGKLVGKVLDAVSKKEAKPAAPRPAGPIAGNWNDAVKGEAGPGAAAAVASGTGCSVRFGNLDRTVEVRSGTTVLDAAIAAGLDLNHYCGGMASCGSCRVSDVVGPVSPLDPMEEATLDVVKERDGDRLGCQTRVLGAVTVTVPPQD